MEILNENGCAQPREVQVPPQVIGGALAHWWFLQILARFVHEISDWRWLAPSLDVARARAFSGSVGVVALHVGFHGWFHAVLHVCLPSLINSNASAWLSQNSACCRTTAKFKTCRWLVLGCIGADFDIHIRIFQHFARSTRFEYLCTAPNSKFYNFLTIFF